MRDWVTNVRNTHHPGLGLGAHPYPCDGAGLSSRNRRGNKKTIHEDGRSFVDEMIACVGGSSNAIGFFFDFLEEEEVRLVGVEAGGRSLDEGEHAARFEGGKLEFFKGAKLGFCKTRTDRSIQPTRSPRGWITQQSALNTLSTKTEAALTMLTSGMRKHWTPLPCCLRRKVFSPPWKPRTVWPTESNAHRKCPKTK